MSKPDIIRRKKETGTTIIEATGHSSSLTDIRAVITDLARQTGFPEDDVAKIEMAVGEACSNVFEHAYAPGKSWSWHHSDPQIRLEVRLKDNCLVIEINDHGGSFDFANYQPPDIQTNIANGEKRGYGIAIMRTFMDEVKYHADPKTCNTLRLVKYLKKS